MAQSQTRRRNRATSRSASNSATVTVELPRPVVDALDSVGRAFGRLTEALLSPATTAIAAASRLRSPSAGTMERAPAARPARRRARTATPAATAATPRRTRRPSGARNLDQRILDAIPPSGMITVQQLRDTPALRSETPQSVTLRLTALARGSRRRPAQIRREGDYVSRLEAARAAA